MPANLKIIGLAPGIVINILRRLLAAKLLFNQRHMVRRNNHDKTAGTVIPGCLPIVIHAVADGVEDLAPVSP